MMARLGLVLVVAGASCAWAQTAISAHSGMVHYVEGRVLLDGQPVDPKFGQFPEVNNNQVLESKDGRAEVLLTPGVFLRLAENSSFKMLSNKLADTAFEALSGSLIVEADELLKDNAITIRYQDATISLKKAGLYRVDVSDGVGKLAVYDGEAEVLDGIKSATAHKGRQMKLDETLLASSFDTKDTDAFYRWAERRSEYIAAANVSSARAAGYGGCSGTYSSTSSLCAGGNGYGGYGSGYGYGLYGNPYGGWAWNPYFGMFTFVPSYGDVFSPFGWAFYSPYTVGVLYVPSYYTGLGAYPAHYTNNGIGPTALSGSRQSPASITSNATGGTIRPGNTLSAAGARNVSAPSGGGLFGGGARSVGGGAVSSGGGGGGVSSGAARSSGGAASAGHSGGGGGGRR